MNGKNQDIRTEGVTLSTSFDLGAMGGSTQGGGILFPVFSPVPSGGTVAVNEHEDKLTITSNGEEKVVLDPMGEVAYRSNNNYWIEQRYFYQMGGLFLEQDSGTTARLSPPISLYKGKPKNGTGDYRLQVKIVAIQILGGHQSTAGQGVARVDTRLREGVTKITDTAGAGKVIRVTVDAHDEKTAKAWRQVFIDAAERGGVEWGTEGDAYPVSIPPIEDESKRVSMICYPGAEVEAVDLDVTRANFTVALQQATMV
ncbi:MAG: hypothetical protein HQQ74_10265 [Methanoculleus bourgensis]|uniref:Uncharacterized protein n=1 Tax=Methanoculleus bourgensis TaxID=83986 RepID=A0A8T7HFD3_9EURY|nr:hypothetical protein [Methanoculleus bourgensis]